MATNQSDINVYVEKQKRKRELQHYYVSFVLMILFTILAFAAVMLRDSINDYLIAIFIVTMAIVQVVFQLYYFMHMKDKDHGFPSLFLYGGAAVAFLTVISFVSIIWIS
ncbi:cytochrome c oxidase subunit 4 [Pullulanibacillus pueri]|uniref:Cytochrome c oxidase subunit 4B n=1 Tax=Pullulanibacillus pueri TaxID=1437324 RepID=A0A8J3EJB3_9BACL|nr:cytochrome C oxidase subunit IV family protein [Pullulanibacillus pueri]MBM7680101.1 cytochrome c oxidase subunit 4 [Pullulanibacillus pueri]GGH74370.1 cytochrome c oxidase subunit 4B [Pullulanibacillus pueri]